MERSTKRRRSAMPGQRGLRGPVTLPRSTLRMSIFFCRTEGAQSRRNIWYWRRVKTLPFGPFRIRQINAVSCNRGNLALWRGPHSHSCGYPRDGGAGKALYSNQHASRSSHLSGGTRHPFGRRHPPGARRCPSRRPRQRTRSRGSVVTAAVQWRAAARCASPRFAHAARLVVPRRVQHLRSTRS